MLLQIQAKAKFGKKESKVLLWVTKSLFMGHGADHHLLPFDFLFSYMKRDRAVRAAELRTKETEIASLEQSVANMSAELRSARSAVMAASTSAGLVPSSSAPSGLAQVVKMVSVSEHEEMMRKIHLASAVEDSNRHLRQDNDRLTAKLREAETKNVHVEAQVVPKDLKVRYLSFTDPLILITC